MYFGANASTVREDAIAGLTGTEKFTISVTENSVTKNVAVDLANVSGTLNLDNIVTEINAQLVAALVDTTFAVERFNEDAYGYRINVGTDETVSFSADASTESSAVYVAGSAGAGATGSGFLVKLDDLAAADPNETFHEVINTTGKADNARGVAVDSSGNVYVVGTTAGDLDGQINAGGNEVYLTKFDAAGNEIYSRLLGSSADANGFAVAVDSSDNVIIAGQVFAPLTDIAFGGGYDAFVTKFDSEGPGDVYATGFSLRQRRRPQPDRRFQRQHHLCRLYQWRDRFFADLRRLGRCLRYQDRQQRDPGREPAIRRIPVPRSQPRSP